jgi:RHS repeat-associated protein
MIAGGTPYYYVRDKLGSVRELVATDGSVAAQYDYDPYGNRTTLSGSVSSDIGFAGYFHHSASGLDFTLYRAYDPTYGRWLNRDPIGESGGLNLYAYVNGNSVNATDRTGLAVNFPMCVTACFASAYEICYRWPGATRALCAFCLLLPEPFGAACLVRCEASPVLNCVAALSIACTVGICVPACLH